MRISSEFKDACDACGKIVISKHGCSMWPVKVTFGQGWTYEFECCHDCVRAADQAGAKAALAAFFRWMKRKQK